MYTFVHEILFMLFWVTVIVFTYRKIVQLVIVVGDTKGDIQVNINIY